MGKITFRPQNLLSLSKKCNGRAIFLYWLYFEGLFKKFYIIRAKYRRWLIIRGIYKIYPICNQIRCCVKKLISRVPASRISCSQLPTNLIIKNYFVIFFLKKIDDYESNLPIQYNIIKQALARHEKLYLLSLSLISSVTVEFVSKHTIQRFFFILAYNTLRWSHGRLAK